MTAFEELERLNLEKPEKEVFGIIIERSTAEQMPTQRHQQYFWQYEAWLPFIR